MEKKSVLNRNDESRDSSIVSNNTNKQQQNGNGSVCSLDGVAGFCTLCRKTSVCVCSRCGDYYCSPECQRRDWQNHRYICFPMPALVYPPSLSANSFNLNENQTLIPAKSFSQEQMPNEYLESGVQLHMPPTNGNSNNNRHQQNQRNPKSQNSIVGSTGYQSPPNCPMPTTNSRVLLTGFRSPNRCYVRSLTPKDDEMFLLFVKKVDAYGKSAPPMTTLPVVNSFAISQLDGVMHRVQVISVRKSNSIRVLFCDNGTTAVRQLSELREISQEILLLPKLTVMVQLRNVENYSLNDRLTAFLSSFEDKEFKICYGRHDERGGTADLFDWQSGKSLNEEIVRFSSESSINIYIDASTVRASPSRGETNSGGEKTDNEGAVEPAISTISTEETLIKANIKKKLTQKPRTTEAIGHEPSKQMEKPVMISPFKSQTLVENLVNVKAIVLDNSCVDCGYIGCIAKSDFSYLLSVQKYLKDFEDTKQPYKPKLNEYCIAKYENDFYRAKVIEIPDETHFTVVYVDFTNESILTSVDIRPYPCDLNIDCRTNLCIIDGLPENLNEKHIKFLKKEIVNNCEFTIDKVKRSEQELVLIECNNLIQKMHDQGLF